MSKINSHPILDVPKRDKVVFTFNGKKIEGEKGFTIAAALHQAGWSGTFSSLWHWEMWGL